MTAKILIVDDENSIRYFLKLELEQQGYEVHTAETGQEALALIKDHTAFDMALLDLRLPDMDGLAIIPYIEKKSPDTGIIIMTAYGTLDSAIEALKHGAIDYILKPFHTASVLASVADGVARVAHPAAEAEQSDKPVTVGALYLNPQTRAASLHNHPLKLTPTEFDLLHCFMQKPNTALDAVFILKVIRGYEASETEARGIVRVHIHRLRQKLEADHTAPTLITTVQGGRYLLKAEA